MNDSVPDAFQEDNEINNSLVLQDRIISYKRENHLDWDDYFMAIAFLSAKRSKDPSTQVGACIVDTEKRIVGVGYNGMPKGCNDDEFPWKKETSNKLDSKYLYVCHAEVNAILNKNAHDLKNCIMYVGLFPCNECAKVILQSGISSIVYMSDKHAHKIETIAAKRMFHAAGITCRQHTPKDKEIVINFNEINWNAMGQLPPTPTKSSN